MSKGRKGETGASMSVHRITKEMRKKAGNGTYKVSKKELEETKERKRRVEMQNELAQEERSKVRNTTYELLSAALETKITRDKVLKCKNFEFFGNGRYAIKCIDEKNMIIELKTEINGNASKFQIK